MASKVLYNGNFYLGNGAWAPALEIGGGGMISNVFAGTGSVSSFAENGIDMKGAWIFPGFEDAHNHPAMMGRVFNEIDFRSEPPAWEEARNIIREKIASVPEGGWVVVHGWNESRWGKIKQEELNRLSETRGIFLINISYHGGLVNSCGEALLKKAGFGLPLDHGYLNEEGFEEVMILTSPSAEDYRAILLKYQEKLFRLGVVAVHDMDVATLSQLKAYYDLDASGTLIMDAVLYLNPRLFKNTEIKKFILLPGNRVKIGGVKIFLDGAIGTHTAALTASYCDEDSQGVMRLAPGECEAIVDAAYGLGLRQAAIHCIGDRAVSAAVSIAEKIKKKYPDMMFRFEHFEMPDDESIRRVAALGGIASMQPNFTWDAGNYRDRMGDRVAVLNPIHKILSFNASLVFGSDDMPSGPIEGIRWATEKAPFPAQKITVEEALRAYTESPAKAVGAGAKRGRIATGYEASFVIMDKNLIDLPAECKVKEAWIRGNKVYSESL